MCCPEQYFILDVSADLRERQRATLVERVPALASRVVWLDTLPAALRGVMLANEVLDAMPVERFVVRDGEINALGVTWQLGRLDWSEMRASEDCVPPYAPSRAISALRCRTATRRK